MATILVTGGAGYIGAHTAKALAGAGHTPVVYDNLLKGHRAAVRWGPFEEGDLADAARLDAVFARWQPAAVVHFAALSEVAHSVADPLLFYDVNVANSLTLVRRALAHGVKAFVLSSTCSVYGDPERLPIDETTPCLPVNTYGRTKLMVETMLADAAAAYGLDAVALRYFNAAGASFEAEIGEDHDPETHLVPLVLMAAGRPERVIGVNGTDYATPDGSCVRDFVHVVDLASAHVAAIERLLAGRLAGFRAINLGTGRGSSVLEILAHAERVTGLPVRREIRPRRVGDPPLLVAEPAAAARLLDWRPRHSDPDTLITTAWRWMQHRGTAATAG
ncbi:UDP-glucose 4-epimerase GalE [Acuticoccus sp. I52.16.1]|uniref:UDP-glucose 4-epimerase GalE n=1 Tax=Acuticoccus sp. I52.16.1 TaxID=2928472 RepID=UPI001FD0F3FD|nr:UDP-glucose 4-epimerase GalE [Acuticoccus sp. I52.16.1]UOM37200.1 UDP-glucose 4-epimerase GalE [Acuticoccus sp. I52.16.1]